MNSQIKLDYKIPQFNYLDYLYQAIEVGSDFKYREVNQITSRFAGKTVAGTIALLKAIISAYRSKRRIAIYVLRMRHKDIEKAGEEVLTGLNSYQIPYYTRKGKGEINALGSKIYIKGCYVSNSNQIAFIGEQGHYHFSHVIVVFEEAFEFDAKTESAIKEAIRGAKYKTGIYRTNPWLLSNWYIRRCFSAVPLDEHNLLQGVGNQIVESHHKIYHYARGTINPNVGQSEKDYLEDIRINNPLRAKTVYYGLPGAYEGMVFAEIVHKIKTNFQLQRWEEFSGGVDVGHVSSATTASLGALEPTKLGKLGEYYHSNKEQKYLEAIELAQAILKFYQEGKDKLHFLELYCYVDNADQGFISLLNTEARRQNKLWFFARPCRKIEVKQRISLYIYAINKGIVGIHHTCQKTLEELRMIAYDEKAEDDKVKLVKQNDHTWDADMYALIPVLSRYVNYEDV